MYDFWIVIVPRILAGMLLAVIIIWGLCAIQRAFLARERVRLLRRIMEYEEYARRVQALLRAVSVAAGSQLADDSYVELAKLSIWKPDTSPREKTYY